MKKLFVLFFIIMSFVFYCFGAQNTVLSKIVNPKDIKVVNNNLYIADGYSIFVYDVKTLRLKKTFGRKGEGPGEFSWPPFKILTYKNFLFFNDQSKVIWFTLDGKLIKEMKRTVWERFYPVKNNLVRLKIDFNRKKREVKVIVSLVNSKKELIKNLYNYIDESMDIALMSDDPKIEKKMLPHFRGVLTDDNNIYIADSKKGLFVKVFDYTGKEINTINPKIKDVEVTEEYKKRAIEKLKESKKRWQLLKDRKFTFYKVFPKIKSFYINNDKIYIQTYEEKNKNSKFIILNKKGNIIKWKFLPTDKVIYTFGKDKYYYLKYNEKRDIWNFFKLNLL